MPKLILTMIYEYDANPDYYPDNSSIAEMAEIDEDNEIEALVMNALESDKTKITIAPA